MYVKLVDDGCRGDVNLHYESSQHDIFMTNFD